MKKVSLTLNTAFLEDCMSGGRRMTVWAGTGLLFISHLKGYDADSIQLSTNGTKILIKRDAVWAVQYPSM